MQIVDPKKASVFVVEDNHNNLFVFEMMLIDIVGVRYFQGVTSGKDLFNVVTNHPAMKVDIVLLDINLPGDDGFTVCQKMREHPRFAEATIVAITANATPENAQRAREVGFDGFLGKPINRNLFPEQIKRICAGEALWEYRH